MMLHMFGGGSAKAVPPKPRPILGANGYRFETNDERIEREWVELQGRRRREAAERRKRRQVERAERRKRRQVERAWTGLRDGGGEIMRDLPILLRDIGERLEKIEELAAKPILYFTPPDSVIRYER